MRPESLMHEILSQSAVHAKSPHVLELERIQDRRPWRHGARRFFRAGGLLLFTLTIVLIVGCREKETTTSAESGVDGATASNTVESTESSSRPGERIELTAPGGEENAADAAASRGDAEGGAQAEADAGTGVPAAGDNAGRLEVDNDADPFVLPGGEIVQVMPHDTRIGLLQNRFSEKSEERRIVAVATRFAEALVAGEADAMAADIAPERQDALMDLLTFSLQAKTRPDRVRFGEIEREAEGEVWMPIALRRRDRASEGEIYLLRSREGAASRWYVRDLLVQFGELADEGNTEVERFEPTEYPTSPLRY